MYPDGKCIMKWQTRVALVLSVVAILACAQSPTGDRGQAQETQARDHWTDPAPGLIWTVKDNGDDVTWHQAMKYCRDLRLDGNSDWRLPTLPELAGIYDKSVEAPGRAGPPKKSRPFTFHVKGNLFLTGNQWSSTRVSEGSAFAWRFDFNEGRSFNGDKIWFYTNKRALCVRSSGK